MTKQTDFSFIRYANCWEDTNILIDALDVTDKTGLSICSGGDNSLALLAKDPKHVYAFDLNKTQLYCTELKIAAIRNLPRKTTLEFLGVNKSTNRKDIYRRIAKDISPEARAYFDTNFNLIENGIIHTGKFEHYFQLFRKYLIPLVIGEKKFQTFATLDVLQDQRIYYAHYINTKRYRALFKIYFGAKVMGKLGRDKNFYRYVDDKNDSAKDIKARVEYGISHSINKTNPYLNYIAFGNYTEDSLPYYLRAENYSHIKKNLDRITLVEGDLTAIKDKNFDFFNLSDIFEYMSEQDFKKNVNKIIKLANKNARIAYWNMQNKRYINDEHFTFQKDLSKSLFERNQSWFYRDFCVYKKVTK